MMLANPRNTIEIIRKYDFHFQKRLGQNFLIDAHVLEKIIRAANIGKEDVVLEIGPGIGTMTQYLAAVAGYVAAVEIDAGLIPILNEALKEYDNVDIIHNDILKLDISEVAREYSPSRPMKVVANLPYYITTPVIMRLLEQNLPVDSITVMVQKEVAARMRAAPGQKDYGALSLAVQYYAEPYLVANVPPNCFIPRPKIGSAVIRLTRRGEPSVRVNDPAFLFRLIRASFKQRRKTLANSLNNDPELSIPKKETAAAISSLGFPADIRGEALTLQQFAQLADILEARAVPTT